MNTEQIVAFLEGKEAYDQKALSQIMLMLEKYPYFQTGHILLLKAMNQTNSENYSTQLNISGSFISDKKKLFQFINSDISIPLFIKENETEKKTIIKATDEKIIVKTPAEIKDKENSVEKIEKEKPFEKIEIKQKIEIEKKDPEKIIKKEKPSLIEKNPLENGTIQEVENINKADLTEEEIIKLTTEKSKIRHKEIIKDFFQATHTPKTEIEAIEPEIELKKTDPIAEVKIDETTTATSNTITADEQNKSEIKKDIIENVITIEKTEIKPEIEQEKKLEQKKEIIIEEKKTSVEEIVREEAVKVSEHKKVDISDTQNSVEKTTEKEKTNINEIENNKKIEKKETAKVENASSEVMSSIFSKIRQIKKEMNINSEVTPETIDVESENDTLRISRAKQIDEKKGGRIIKETFIGFPEEEIKNERINDEQESNEIEKEVIKESGITAKDLFKQHVKNKEQSTGSETENDSNDSISSNTKVISPISKVVANLDDDKTSKTIIEKESVPTVYDESKKEIIEEKKEVLDKSSNNQLSAAELLIKKITEKKQRMKEEKEKEEQEKLIEQQRIIELIQNPIKEDEIKKSDEYIDLISENNDADKTQNEFSISKEIGSNENSNTENNIPEFKVKKSAKLIDSFIEKIETFEKIGSKESSLSGDVSISSTDEKEEFMTETMADIQIQQKNYPKAIEIYKKLILKFPEKKTYFAIQIKKTESLIKS